MRDLLHLRIPFNFSSLTRLQFQDMVLKITEINLIKTKCSYKYGNANCSTEL